MLTGYDVAVGENEATSAEDRSVTFQRSADAYASSVGLSAATSDIFGCAGRFAGDPTGCAALNRHTAQLPRAQWADPSRFYQQSPANWYAKFWHDRAINGRAYGFPYDVADQSSFVSHGDPQWLLVAVGW
ncbi:beta-1,3-glucanase family protein [Micromonospora sp. WMMD1076]|uniref:beta-1,3-glucanase family protein n=1 Tax=Micromonospora sp. WMMD1076 TaxID=3016103 RepID=UPI002499C712|nr:beta-1,3-glucanase family protein [Micromonospora sp. WMMD1076]WFF05914.1 beta-1,3-glucanase family protein [Micromonospora sp. WMMD1076]